MYITFAHGRTFFEKVLFFSADQGYTYVYTYLDYFSNFTPILTKVSIPFFQWKVRFFLFERCILGIKTAKISTRTHEDFRSWSRMKVLLAISWCSNEITNLTNMLTRVRNCEILKPIARILPKLHPNEVLPEVVF